MGIAGSRCSTHRATPRVRRGLWDPAECTLFTGDAIYADARLSFDDPAAALTSLERIAALPVRVAHAGHERSIAGEELQALAAATIVDLRAGRYSR